MADRRINARSGSLLVVSVLVALSLHSCAYFNTLYNARRLYKEAEELREQQGSGRQLKDKYEEVIKKCANLIAGYPNSRWIDDALFLMGQSLVRQGELDKGIRKFMELRTNYPESDYAAPSLYWLALAYFEKRDYAQALEFAERFLNRHPKHEMRFRVMFLAGDILLELERTEEALNYYALVAEQASRREVVDEAVLKSAELFYKKEQWSEATASYERALRKGLAWRQRYEISIALGECYTKIGKCAEAMKLFDDLDEEVTTSKEKPAILLGRASSYECMDSLGAAIRQYEIVTKDFPKSIYSAEAYYRIGVIYHEKLDSLELAQEAYSKVGGEYANSEYATEALQRSASLNRLIELQKTEGGEETREQAAEKRFLTAEIQLMRLNEIKAAIANYRAVVDSFPAADVAPKAAYALAYIQHYRFADTLRAIDLYRDVAVRYPRSPQAKGAVIELGHLGASELKSTLVAYIDSAIADTAAARAEELERRRAMGLDTVAVDTTAAGGAVPDSVLVHGPRAVIDTAKVVTRGAPADSAKPMLPPPSDTTKAVVPVAAPDTSKAAPDSSAAKRAAGDGSAVKGAAGDSSAAGDAGDRKEYR